MYRSDVRTRLEGSLDPSPSPTAGPGNRLAAVLLPLLEDRLVLTRRTEHLSRHPGEISFPGGLTQDEDADLAATALRETQEELGLSPEEVEVLGALAPVHTFVSAILIVPFVGVVSGNPAFAPTAFGAVTSPVIDPTTGAAGAAWSGTFSIVGGPAATFTCCAAGAWNCAGGTIVTLYCPAGTPGMT